MMEKFKSVTPSEFFLRPNMCKVVWLVLHELPQYVVQSITGVISCTRYHMTRATNPIDE